MAQAGVERHDRGGPMGEIVTFRDQGLGNASYLVDLGDGRGLVLDPSRDPGPYLDAAARRGLRLAWTAETHLHADFVSGSHELAAHGATVLAPAAARLGFPHRGLGDGDQLDLGGLGLRALATPGHTPEHLAFLLADGAQPLARALWRSLHQRVLTLPDDLGVYPTHGAGSFCSAPTGTAPTTTIAHEKATNPLLAAPDEDTFVKLLVGGLGSYPRYFLRLRETNRRGPRIWGATPPPLTPLPPQQARRLVAGGAELVDARPIAAFAAGHVPGALSIPLRPSFATWLGWLVPDDRPLLVVLEPDQHRGDLVRQARKVGYARLAGELDGGKAAWRSAGLPVARTPLVGLDGAEGRRVLDVRQDAEFAAGHIPGAAHVELGALTDPADLPAGPTRAGAWNHNGDQRRRRAAGAARPARQPGPVPAAGGGQRPGRRDGRPGAHGRAPARHPHLPPAGVQRRPVVHRGVRRHQGADQPVRGDAVGPPGTKAGAGRGVAGGPAGAAAGDLGAVVGVGGRGQRAARHQPGADLVDHGDHEDRPGRPQAAGVGDGAQRGGRLRRRGRHGPGDRLHRPARRPAARAVLPRDRLRRARPWPVGAAGARNPRLRRA